MSASDDLHTRIRLAGILLDLVGRWEDRAAHEDTDTYAAASLREAAEELRDFVRDELL
jgi:hypothetical protein